MGFNTGALGNGNFPRLDEALDFQQASALQPSIVRIFVGTPDVLNLASDLNPENLPQGLSFSCRPVVFLP